MIDRWFVQSPTKYFFRKVLPFFKQFLQQLVCYVVFCLNYSCFVQYLHMVTAGWKLIVVMANKLQLRYLWGRASKIPSGVGVWLRFIERLVIIGDSNLSPPTLVLHLNCVVWNHPAAVPSGGCNVAIASLCDFCKKVIFFFFFQSRQPFCNFNQCITVMQCLDRIPRLCTIYRDWWLKHHL